MFPNKCYTQNMELKEYKITGMTCAACAAQVERVTKRLPGVEASSVNLATERLRIRGESLTDDAVFAAVQKAGFSASPVGDRRSQAESDRAERQTRQKVQKRRLIVALCFAVPLFYASMGPMIGLPFPISMHDQPVAYAIVQMVLLLPVLIAGRHFYVRGFRALLRGAPNMDTLIAIGTVSSIGYSIYSFIRILSGDAMAAHDMYWESAGVIVALVMLGKHLESQSKQKTGDAVYRLLSLTPDTAHVLGKDGTEHELPVEHLVVGDRLIVRAGERIPTDGILEEGDASADESMLTGESLPVEKHPGDALTGGSINGNTRLVMRATRVGDDTTLAQMVRLVEDAQGSKAPISRLADRISAVFVPVVGAIALISAILWLLAGESFSFALTIFVSVLVIACPCALGLATPTAIMVGTGLAAQYGILIKSGEALEHTQNLSVIAMDKTGTVTNGKPVVTDLLPEGLAETDFLQLFASGEQGSEHPLARAILAAAQERKLSLLPVSDFTALPGRGARASVDGKTLLMGNAALLTEANVTVPEAYLQLARQGKTPMYLSVDGVFAGCAAVADTIKADSAEAVRLLDGIGVRSILLTGDNAATASAIAKEAGIDDVRAGLMPADKLNCIQRLQAEGAHVGMAGDGINDAPALALADVGFAVGSGTDVSIASADVVLMHDRLTDVVEAIRISKCTMRIIRENLFWAFFYNSIGIPIAAGLLHIFGGPLLSPMIAALAMSFSSVTVLSNTLRLKRVYRKARKQAGIA